MPFSYAADPVTGKITQTDMTDPRGTVTRTTSMRTAIPAKFLPLGRTEQQTITYNRDPNTNLLNSITDPLSHQTAFTYDLLGNLISITRMNGTPTR